VIGSTSACHVALCSGHWPAPSPDMRGKEKNEKQ
jgi:hypothetical protein